MPSTLNLHAAAAHNCWPSTTLCSDPTPCSPPWNKQVNRSHISSVRTHTLFPCTRPRLHWQDEWCRLTKCVLPFTSCSGSSMKINIAPVLSKLGVHFRDRQKGSRESSQDTYRTPLLHKTHVLHREMIIPSYWKIQIFKMNPQAKMNYCNNCNPRMSTNQKGTADHLLCATTGTAAPCP